MNLLVLRALGLGDLAAAVPALRGLRAAFAGHTITLATPDTLAPLAMLSGAVDAVLPHPGLDVPLRPGRPPDVAVNLHGRGPRSHALLHAARPGHLLGFACPAAGIDDGPPWRDDEHETHRWCRMLTWYGVGCDPADLALAVPPVPPPAPGATIVHPGAKFADRRWQPARFAAVARALAAAGHRVVVTGSAAEVPLAKAVASGARLPPDRVLAGGTDALALAAQVAAARLLISGDTGIAHLATAYGTPSAVLFGPVPPQRWGPPPGRAEHQVCWHPEAAGTGTRAASGATGALGPHPALAAVSVAEVLAAAGRALGADRRRRAVAPGGRSRAG